MKTSTQDNRQGELRSEHRRAQLLAKGPVDGGGDDSGKAVEAGSAAPPSEPAAAERVSAVAGTASPSPFSPAVSSLVRTTVEAAAGQAAPEGPGSRTGGDAHAAAASTNAILKRLIFAGAQWARPLAAAAGRGGVSPALRTVRTAAVHPPDPEMDFDLVRMTLCSVDTLQTYVQNEAIRLDTAYFSQWEEIAMSSRTALLLYNVDSNEVIGAWTAVANDGAHITWKVIRRLAPMTREAFQASAAGGIFPKLPPTDRSASARGDDARTVLRVLMEHSLTSSGMPSAAADNALAMPPASAVPAPASAVEAAQDVPAPPGVRPLVRAAPVAPGLGGPAAGSSLVPPAPGAQGPPVGLTTPSHSAPLEGAVPAPNAAMSARTAFGGGPSAAAAGGVGAAEVTAPTAGSAVRAVSSTATLASPTGTGAPVVAASVINAAAGAAASAAAPAAAAPVVTAPGAAPTITVVAAGLALPPPSGAAPPPAPPSYLPPFLYLQQQRRPVATAGVPQPDGQSIPPPAYQPPPQTQQVIQQAQASPALQPYQPTQQTNQPAHVPQQAPVSDPARGPVPVQVAVQPSPVLAHTTAAPVAPPPGTAAPLPASGPVSVRPGFINAARNFASPVAGGAPLVRPLIPVSYSNQPMIRPLQQAPAGVPLMTRPIGPGVTGFMGAGAPMNRPPAPTAPAAAARFVTPPPFGGPPAAVPAAVAPAPPAQARAAAPALTLVCPLCQERTGCWWLMGCNHMGPCDVCCLFTDTNQVAASYPACARCDKPVAVSELKKVHM